MRKGGSSVSSVHVCAQVTWPAGEPEAPVLGQLLMDFFHLFGERSSTRLGLGCQ